jgi:hypothetical protein
MHIGPSRKGGLPQKGATFVRCRVPVGAGEGELLTPGLAPPPGGTAAGPNLARSHEPLVLPIKEPGRQERFGQPWHHVGGARRRGN